MKKLGKWETRKLNELVDRPIAYGVLKPSKFVSSGVPMFRIQDIDNNGRIAGKEIHRISPELDYEFRRTKLREGDLIYSVVGTIGKMYEIPSEYADANISRAFCVIGIADSVTRAFVKQYLQGNGSLEWKSLEAAGNAQKVMNMATLRNLPIPLPSPFEQKRIADILTTWDEALVKFDALITAKDRRKQALMQQLLTGGKRFPAFGKKTWTKVRMNQVLERVFRPIEWSAEMSLSLISIRRRCGGLFRRPDLLGSEYKTQDLHELKAGDFLVSKRQVVHGAWAIVTPEFEGGHVSKEYAIFDNIAPEKLHMPFLAWLAQTPRMIRLARVASTGVHIEKLIFDPDVFLRESIRIPADLAEQRKIAAILDSADHELTLLRTQRNALDLQKRGLMQRLLTGTIRVNHPNH